jgi:hypothetical protein
MGSIHAKSRSMNPHAVIHNPQCRDRPTGGEGRTRTFEAARATDLQSAAFDRFATSPAVCVWWKRDAVDTAAVLRVVTLSMLFLVDVVDVNPRALTLWPMELAKGFEPPTC